MSILVATQTAEIGQCDQQGVSASLADVPAGTDVNMEVEPEDEEDEDVDFNPSLRGDTPSEASYSLSSDNEGVGDNAERNLWSSSKGKDAGVSSRPMDETRGCEDEESVMQTTLNGKEDFSGNPIEKEFTSSTQQGQGRTCPEGSNNDLSSEKRSDGVSNLARDENSQGPIIDIDDEDAICKRTRARHSLANYTLEELETFLQESDDDDNPPNVDDEEEYRKFLTAVLLEGADDGKAGQEDEIADEDEENDADFELEIEEALESDVDENIGCNRVRDDEKEGDVRMPVTRQKKRLKESTKNKKTLLGQAKMPLCPLMPYGSIAHTAAFPTHGWKFSPPKGFSHCSPSFSGADVITGFTAHQIGQLYCLVHEHVQLLIQVFAVSVLDPSRQQVASGVQKMISEMTSRREEALARRKVPYPEFCFQPPNFHSSLHFDFHQAANCSYWIPSIDNPVLSILDVAPLRLVKSFMTDISDTVLKYRQSHLEDVANKNHLIREPLFPLPTVDSSSDTNNETSEGTTTMHSNIHLPIQLSPGKVQPKKSLAAIIVEDTKKQSVALVPKDVARSAQRFYPLFNAALFPHKPPAPAVANRVLFTDAEDGLLAMGLMEYNNDWAAIQQHFLPSKSTHQIFVRQKNRSSSKAPENPIKAVRRMKSSPLTEDEKARINEGLKLFRNEWLSVWKFVVPYRDPALLRRQWRVATGTQISYSKSEAMKEKRRSYDAKRRRIKSSIDDCHTSPEKEVDNGGDNSAGDMDGDDEAYVHEAFLADSEHGNFKHVPYDTPLPINRIDMKSINMPYRGSYIHETCAFVRNGSGESQWESGYGNLNSSLQDVRRPSHFSQVRSSASSNQLSSKLMSRASNRHPVERPCKPHKIKGVRVVKLSPDLPPVNLPPSVRVISQSAFYSYHSESSCSKLGDNALKDHVPRSPQVAKVGTYTLNRGEHRSKFSDNGLDTSHRQDVGTFVSQFGPEENTSESDLHMHPLLFQAPEYRLSSSFPVNCHTTASSTYNFPPGNPLQVDLSPFRTQHPVRLVDHSNVTSHLEEPPSDLCVIDFHPLLQRADNGSSDSAMVPSLYRLSGDLRAAQGNSDEFDRSDCSLRETAVGDGQVATCLKSLSHNEKQNNLDLDIRLYSAPDKAKTLGRDVNEHHNVEVTIPTGEHRMVEKSQQTDVSILNCSDKCPDVSAINCTSVKAFTCSQQDVFSFQVVSPSNGGVCQYTGDLDDSISGIVMEQEELSDSEEEIEHVEFEREEIDDSEGDELDSELPTGIHNKVFPFFTSKEDEILANHSLQPLQSIYLKKGSAAKGDNCPSQMPSPDVCSARLSRLKPKRDSVKRNRSCRSSPDVLHPPARSSKKQSADRSKLPPLRTVQCKVAAAAAASRKPRKQSL